MAKVRRQMNISRRILRSTMPPGIRGKLSTALGWRLPCPASLTTDIFFQILLFVTSRSANAMKTKFWKNCLKRFAVWVSDDEYFLIERRQTERCYCHPDAFCRWGTWNWQHASVSLSISDLIFVRNNQVYFTEMKLFVNVHWWAYLLNILTDAIACTYEQLLLSAVYSLHIMAAPSMNHSIPLLGCSWTLSIETIFVHLSLPHFYFLHCNTFLWP